jgi:hypothetical protein
MPAGILEKLSNESKSICDLAIKCRLKKPTSKLRERIKELHIHIHFQFQSRTGFISNRKIKRL